MIANGTYPFLYVPVWVPSAEQTKNPALLTSAQNNLVPGSDMSGEVVKVGSEVTKWKVGDKVCANFNVEHLFGDVDGSMMKGALGGGCDGVWTQYKVVPAQVSDRD